MAIGVAVIGVRMAGRGHAAAYRAATSLYGSDLPEMKLVAIGDVSRAMNVIDAAGTSWAKDGTKVEVPPFAPTYLRSLR